DNPPDGTTYNARETVVSHFLRWGRSLPPLRRPSQRLYDYRPNLLPVVGSKRVLPRHGQSQYWCRISVLHPPDYGPESLWLRPARIVPPIVRRALYYRTANTLLRPDVQSAELGTPRTPRNQPWWLVPSLAERC